MILLTDGENNRGAIDPRTAAKAAAVFGIKIYTIGVGTEGMAPVPVGRGLFGLRYENRLVRIDEPLLADIAKTTGGRYFRARDAAALQRIYEEIDQLEREPVRTRVVRALHGAVPLAAVLRALIAGGRGDARRAAGAAAVMPDVTFDYPYLLALAVVLPVLAVLVLRHAYRAAARRASIGSARMDVISRLIPPRTLREPGWRMVRLGVAGALVGDRRRRPALGRRTDRRALARHRHGARARRLAVDDGARTSGRAVSSE